MCLARNGSLTCIENFQMVSLHTNSCRIKYIVLHKTLNTGPIRSIETKVWQKTETRVGRGFLQPTFPSSADSAATTLAERGDAKDVPSIISGEFVGLESRCEIPFTFHHFRTTISAAITQSFAFTNFAYFGKPVLSN